MMLPSAAGMHIAAGLRADTDVDDDLALAWQMGMGLNGWSTAISETRAGLTFGLGRIAEDAIAPAVSILKPLLD